MPLDVLLATHSDGDCSSVRKDTTQEVHRTALRACPTTLALTAGFACEQRSEPVERGLCTHQLVFEILDLAFGVCGYLCVRVELPSGVGNLPVRVPVSVLPDHLPALHGIEYAPKSPASRQLPCRRLYSHCAKESSPSRHGWTSIPMVQALRPILRSTSPQQMKQRSRRRSGQYNIHGWHHARRAVLQRGQIFALRRQLLPSNRTQRLALHTLGLWPFRPSHPLRSLS
jgi:hypothetical protein